MKKIFKAALTVIVSCIAAMAMSVGVSAATEDIELSTVSAKTTNGAWGQSVVYSRAQFDCAKLTEDSVIMIEYTVEGDVVNSAGYPAELILQNYTVDPQIWAQVAPFEFTDTSASYKYDDIVAKYAEYGQTDLGTVDNLCIGDVGAVLTVTKVTVTNCEIPEVTTTTAATTTEQITEAQTEAETTAATTQAEEAPAEKKGGVPIVLIVVITVVVAVAVVVTIIIIKSKKRFY